MVVQLLTPKPKFSDLGKLKSGEESKQKHSLAKISKANFLANVNFDCATNETGMSRNEDDWGMVQDATAELERGLEAAGDGPPHLGHEGADGSGGELASTDTEEMVAGAMSSDGDEDNDEHPDDGGGQRSPSFPPGDFQDKSKGAHKLLGMAAFYCATGRQMLLEHRKVQGQADMYMTEVCASYWSASIPQKYRSNCSLTDHALDGARGCRPQ